MKSDVQVNLRRLGMLIWNDLWSWRYLALFITSSIVGLMSIAVIVGVGLNHQGNGSVNWSGHESLFSALLIVLGLIWTSVVFTKLGTTSGLVSSIMLPASCEEKFLAKWLLSTIGILLGILLIYKVHILISGAVTQFIFSDPLPPFNPFTEETLDTIHMFLIAQSVMFLGAIYFRKMAFIQTLFVLLVLALAYSVFILLMLRVFFLKDLIYGGSFMEVINNFDKSSLKKIEEAATIFGSYLLAPICWVIACIRFRETEV